MEERFGFCPGPAAATQAASHPDSFRLLQAPSGSLCIASNTASVFDEMHVTLCSLLRVSSDDNTSTCKDNETINSHMHDSRFHSMTQLSGFILNVFTSSAVCSLALLCEWHQNSKSPSSLSSPLSPSHLILSGTLWVWLPSLWQLPAYCERLVAPWSRRRAMAPWVSTETPLAIRLQN